MTTNKENDPVKSALLFFGFCCALISLPIWYYLLYKVLVYTQATDLMWFLYWAYLPASFLGTAVSQLLKAIGEAA